MQVGSFNRDRSTAAKSGNTRVAIASLTTRLDSIDDDYHDLRSAVLGLGKRIDDLGSSINAKIDQRSQPQWQTYIAGAMLLGGLFFAFIAPIQETQKTMTAAIRDTVLEHRGHEAHDEAILERRNELFLTAKEFGQYQKRIDDRLTSIEKAR